jgi:hypothetical protein
MLASMAWTMWFFYGLDYAFAYAASMIHLWATIRGKSFPVTNSLAIPDSTNVFEKVLRSCYRG